jgi:type II secretory pathway component PulL
MNEAQAAQMVNGLHVIAVELNQLNSFLQGNLLQAMAIQRTRHRVPAWAWTALSIFILLLLWMVVKTGTSHP